MSNRFITSIHFACYDYNLSNNSFNFRSPTPQPSSSSSPPTSSTNPTGSTNSINQSTNQSTNLTPLWQSSLLPPLPPASEEKLKIMGFYEMEGHDEKRAKMIEMNDRTGITKGSISDVEMEDEMIEQNGGVEMMTEDDNDDEEKAKLKENDRMEVTKEGEDDDEKEAAIMKGRKDCNNNDEGIMVPHIAVFDESMTRSPIRKPQPTYWGKLKSCLSRFSPWK